jgi:competence protein ComEC
MPRAGWLALGAIGGALLAIEVGSPALDVLAAGLAAAVGAVALVIRRPQVAALAIAGALILGRAAAVGFLAPPLPVAPEDGAATAASGATSEHSAVVLSVGTPGGGLQRAVLELAPPDPPDRVYAWLPRYPPIVPTDRVRFRGALEPPAEGPGFGEFLARSAIDFTTRAREMERLATDDSPLAALEHVRRSAGGMLTSVLPEPQAGLGVAILIGLRDLVARDVSDDFRTAGLSHVVAISGWHIALLGAVVGAMLRGLERRRRSALVLAAIVSYSILAGGSPSVIRAALMASVVLLARESGRRGQASAALGLAVAGMLLVEPATVSDVGFQLSVAATAGLLRWASPLQSWIRPRLPSATPGWLVEALAVSLAAQAATLPLVLLHFGRLSLVAPLANLLVAPIVAPVMLATAAALAAGALLSVGVPAVILAPFTLLGALSLGTMIAIGRVTADLPFASVELPAPFNLASAAVAAAGLLWLLRRRAPEARTQPEPGATRAHGSTRRPGLRTAAVGAACVMALVLALAATARPDFRLHMTVLDVGQGDAILLEGPTGSRILVDTGPDPDRLLALLDERLPAWDRRLDLVVITHPHEDHVSGLALLLDRYRIGGVAEPGMIGPGPGDAAFRRRMAELNRQTRVIAAGDHLALDGVRIAIRWPPPGSVPLRPADGGTAVNNVSLVLDIRFGDRRMLLTGDVEEQIDPRLLAAGLADPDAPLDVLKVAHHGSGTATTDAFVAQMAPRVAVISAGWGNPYGHPSPATVARLEGSGAQLFRTDLDGSISITTDGHDLSAHAGGGRPRPPRPASELPPGIGFCPLPQPVRGARRRPREGRVGSLKRRDLTPRPGGQPRPPALGVVSPLARPGCRAARRPHTRSRRPPSPSSATCRRRAPPGRSPRSRPPAG